MGSQRVLDSAAFIKQGGKDQVGNTGGVCAYGVSSTSR